jgi:type I restriction enzyme S subunit
MNNVMSKIKIPCPPIIEQKDIHDFVKKETDSFISLISEAQRAIALLHERRTALISAAVTGAIDVRAIGTPHPESEEHA